jgi:hypothetical protein
MAIYVATGYLPGLVTLVACGDDVHVVAIGTPSFADDTPLARDAIFRIASLTPRSGVTGIVLTEREANSPAPPPIRQDFWAGINAATLIPPE